MTMNEALAILMRDSAGLVALKEINEDNDLLTFSRAVSLAQNMVCMASDFIVEKWGEIKHLGEEELASTFEDWLVEYIEG